MPKVLTEKEVDDLLKALAGGPVVSFSEEKKAMNINIVRKGFANIPLDAKRCPVCGKIIQHYELADIRYANPVAIQCQYVVNDFAQKYPTFICDNCQTIWQYLGEKEEKTEEEKE